MLGKNISTWQAWLIFFLLASLGLLAACGSSSGEPTPTPYQGVRTWLLVKAPDGPLPLGRAVTVKSRTEDSRHQVSHVELYAVQWPGVTGDLLIRSDAAPFDQTSFTAVQAFTPALQGHYVIKVVGYNKLGERAESDYIGFDVE